MEGTLVHNYTNESLYQLQLFDDAGHNSCLKEFIYPNSNYIPDANFVRGLGFNGGNNSFCICNSCSYYGGSSANDLITHVFYQFFSRKNISPELHDVIDDKVIKRPVFITSFCPNCNDPLVSLSGRLMTNMLHKLHNNPIEHVAPMVNNFCGTITDHLVSDLDRDFTQIYSVTVAKKIYAAILRIADKDVWDKSRMLSLLYIAELEAEFLGSIVCRAIYELCGNYSGRLTADNGDSMAMGIGSSGVLDTIEGITVPNASSSQDRLVFSADVYTTIFPQNTLDDSNTYNKVELDFIKE